MNEDDGMAWAPSQRLVMEAGEARAENEPLQALHGILEGLTCLGGRGLELRDKCTACFGVPALY